MKRQNEIDRLWAVLDHADTVVIGAGAGLSTSAGFTYDGARFEKYFSDFAAKYGSGVLAPEPLLSLSAPYSITISTLLPLLSRARLTTSFLCMRSSSSVL